MAFVELLGLLSSLFTVLRKRFDYHVLQYRNSTSVAYISISFGICLPYTIICKPPLKHLQKISANLCVQVFFAGLVAK